MIEPLEAWPRRRGIIIVENMRQQSEREQRENDALKAHGAMWLERDRRSRRNWVIVAIAVPVCFFLAVWFTHV